MASSGSVFSETLQTITTTKLEELAKQRTSFEEQLTELLAATSPEKDPLKRLIILVDRAKTCLGVAKDSQGRVLVGSTNNPRLETDLKNLDRFLEQARYDPSVSEKVVMDWERSIRQYLTVQSAKYQYADLYGKLVTEWLSSEKSTPADSDVEMGESFEEIPGAKKLEARAEWEKTVFEPASVDLDALKRYLDTLFITDQKDVARAIRELREKVEQRENTLSGPSQFNVHTLRWVIQGVQSSDLLSNEKREVLKDFLGNDVILSEIADVLNMRMGALSRWTWGDHVPLEERRKLNGTYSIHMHEDLLQAIFLHYIGVKWSVFFKAAFKALRKAAWKSNQADVPKTDRLRRQYFLGPKSTNQNSLQLERANKYRRQYFAHQLLDYDTQEIEYNEGEEEAEFEDFAEPVRKRTRTKQTARASVYRPMPQQTFSTAAPRKQLASKAARKVPSRILADDEGLEYSEEDDDEEVSDEDDDVPAKKSPMEAKQTLLHLLSTEIVINRQLYGELTCFRSVFESWNPLLPHDTILSVLEFFGVSKKWLDFFKTFLQAPLKFTDDQSASPRLRRRGTPGSHALSDVFGEIVLGCLDFAVNQATGGGMLHRLYDDIWFWSKDYETCAKAWASVLDFTEAMGVQLSEIKTGSVRIARGGAELDIDDRLPDGEIRWGFLYLDSTSGRFEIDQKMVDAHIEELRKQLQGKTKSIIDWIQAWNTYAATFFSSNFGKAANCFGREHVDKMLATHRHIQESIFEGGNVVQFLKQTISDRFSVKEVPDGFLFFPVELGGLDLKSPFVGLLQIRESVKEDPNTFLTEYEETEREVYTQAKQRFDKGDIQRQHYSNDEPDFKPKDADTFFPFEEYTRYREEFRPLGRASLIRVHRELLQRPTEQSIDVSVKVKQEIEQLRGQSNLRGITSDWYSMEPYWKWVAQMYGPEMVERFGGLNVVDPGLLPIGMVSMFRQKRMKWQE